MWRFFFSAREMNKKHRKIAPFFLIGFLVCGFPGVVSAAENTPNLNIDTRQDRTLGNQNSIFIGRDRETGDNVIRTPQINQPSQPNPPSVYYISPEVNVPSGGYYQNTPNNWSEPNYYRPNHRYPNGQSWSDNSDRYPRRHDRDDWQKRHPNERPPQWDGSRPPQMNGPQHPYDPRFNRNDNKRPTPPPPPPSWGKNQDRRPPQWNDSRRQWNNTPPPPPPPPGWNNNRFKNEPPAWGRDKHKKPKHWDRDRKKHDRRYY